MKGKKAQLASKTLKKRAKKAKTRSAKKQTPNSVHSLPPSVHPWRVCPYGQHLVRTHPLSIPPSQTDPQESKTIRHEHCADNPSGKDQMYPHEIQEIAEQNFSNLKNKPCPLELKWPGIARQYDEFIAGWVQYWNEVLKPDEPLDPNLVKALIASESRFVITILANPKNSNSARGLMQITNDTRKHLGGDPGGLTDHLITLKKLELNEPNTNICAGIRWLFEKRRLASSKMKKQATWIETTWDYKGLSLASSPKAEQGIRNKFLDFYKDLTECKTK